MKHHIQEIDTLRAFAILFVILAHIDSYTNSIFFEKWDALFAFLGVGLFFFISGYLLDSSPKITSKRTIIRFLTKRASTIYPLYWTSIIISYLIINIFNTNILNLEIYDYNKINILAYNIIGLQGLMPESYSLSIWWFIGTILVYYVIASILMFYSKNIRDLMIYSFIPLFILLFLKNEYDLIHVSTLEYYSVFIIGIITSKVKDMNSLKYLIIYYCLLSLLFFAMLIFDVDNKINIIKRLLMFLPILSIIILYKMRYYKQNKYQQFPFIADIASPSYTIYLFHLQILTIFEFAVRPFIENLNPIVMDSIMIVIGIPTIFIVGYYLDIILKTIKNNISLRKDKYLYSP